MKGDPGTGPLPPGPWDVAVVGGGPAGLLAAGRAAMLGARVLLLEKMEKPARKLRITGKGRANITNMRPLEEHLREIRPEPRFLRGAFGAFFNRDLVDLLAAEGVEVRVERGDRVFPASGRAWDVAEALAAWAVRQGAVLVPRARVEALVVHDGVFAGLEVVRTGSGLRQRVEAPRCVLATGGLSYPGTGSTGDGLAFAEATGHRLTAPFPSLVGLRTRPALEEVQGLDLRNVALTVWIDGRKQDTEFGEADVTARGLGGPIVLRQSRRIVEALAAGRRVEAALDLKPALDPPTLEARLARELEARRTCGDLLRSLLPPLLVPVFLARLGLDAAAPAARLQEGLRRRLLALLKDFRLEVVGHGGWEEAIVTAGGVSLKDVDPRTLASRRVAGLHFAGEVLDLDANTGGYNLQIAFSTGWLAGEAAARAILNPGE
ncbi:BaiN/RdsA family NAD(P)/FAD-dependent oxidoreductase [Mesoterricola sediminis]|uniref:Aminoacetone oxidase family FAD-binding enzyme n=1 Tax=Mesoterricola sediminis TaxID=2927980 RepID=A0AA48KD74_9BACT|nr:aminoacetone oxidase family FAD-binding enzyme [Mesoterricola sediminis]BDU76027.1 aminoacetone oxidase family FAD-binding enzyme [Mesoterricola sediminis]